MNDQKKLPRFKIKYRDPQGMEIHPALKGMPAMDKNGEAFLEFRRGVRETKTMPPILLDSQGRIVDGRHRCWAAQMLGWQTVPTQTVPDEQIYNLIFHTLAHHRHYTKGQLAFIIVPIMEDIFAESKARTLENLKKSPVSSICTDATTPEKGCKTPETLALSLGISYRVLMQAKELRTLFGNDQTKRTLTDKNEVTEENVTLEEFFTPRILLCEDPEAPRTRPYGLGAVLAACAAIIKQKPDHGGGRPASVQKQLDLFETSLTGFTAKFSYWQKWEPETRLAAVASLPPVVEKMPDELLHEFAKVVSKELKRRDAGVSK